MDTETKQNDDWKLSPEEAMSNAEIGEVAEYLKSTGSRPLNIDEGLAKCRGILGSSRKAP